MTHGTTAMLPRTAIIITSSSFRTDDVMLSHDFNTARQHDSLGHSINSRQSVQRQNRNYNTTD